MPSPRSIGLQRLGLRRLGQPPSSGGGGITSITSSDGSVVVTDPTGPVTDLSVPGGSEIEIGQVTYGQGVAGTDDVVPVSASGTIAYLGAAMDAVSIGNPTNVLSDSPRYEFLVPHALSGLRLCVFITSINAQGAEIVLVGVGGAITIDGVRNNALNWGVTSDAPFTETAIAQDHELDIVVAAGQTVGVTIETFAGMTGANVQVQIVIRGKIDNDTGPFISPDLTLWLESISDDGFDLEVDGDGHVTRWPNRAPSYSGIYDATDVGAPAVPGPFIAAADLNGNDVVHYTSDPIFGSVPDQTLGTTGASGTILAPQVAGNLPPCHIFALVNLENAGAFSLSHFLTLRHSDVVATTTHIGNPTSAGFGDAGIALKVQSGFPDYAIFPNPLISLANQWHLIDFEVVDGTTSRYFIDGLEVTLQASSNPNPAGAIGDVVDYYLGSGPAGGNFIRGKQAVIIAYKVAISAGEAAKTRAYIRRRFGIT